LWAVAIAVGAGVAWSLLRWPDALQILGLGADFPLQRPQSSAPAPSLHPLVELRKLVVAALLGIIITAVHKRFHREKPLSRSLEHAQVLLCISGAMMMIIIGDSFARALGIAGGASIIRFRTPVEDPKDTTILFLLLGLGMSCGMGAIGVAGLGTLFLCLCLAALDLFAERKPRVMVLELVADGREFPAAHVQSVFARHDIVVEPREVSHGKEAKVKYHITFGRHASLQDLSSQLMNGEATGIKSMEWKAPKKRI